MHGKDRKAKIVGYGLQLHEKQKAKRMYFTLEGQFREYYEKANRATGVTGELLIQQLERRLDNVAFRLGLSPSRAARLGRWFATATSPSTARRSTFLPTR
jgi:small subunit ribosomal protein S4